MISSAQIEERIRFFLPFLPTDVTDALNTCWHGTGSPLIITDVELINKNPFRTVKIASAELGVHKYRLDYMNESNMDIIILHEMAHDYCFTIKKHDYDLYRFGKDKNYQNLVESEVQEISLNWLRHIQNHNKNQKV